MYGRWENPSASPSILQRRAAVLEEILPDVDQVLVMAVDPGFGHQHFLHSTLAKISRVRQMIDRVKPECDLEDRWRYRFGNREALRESGSERSGGGIFSLWSQQIVPEAMSFLRAEEESIKCKSE